MAVDKIIYDVDLAGDIKNLISINSDVGYDDPSLRDKILKFNDNDLVRVGKKIGSLKIISVDIVDNDFLDSIFRGKESEQDEISE